MKTLADIKRRIQPGVRLICVENTKRPELNGKERIITKVQTKAFVWIHADEDAKAAKGSWTNYAPARDVDILDENTFRMAIANWDGKTIDPTITVTLRFIP